MKRFSGYEAKKASGREYLPAGGYTAKILDAKEVRYDWGEVLIFSFDILEGQYKDFFAADYRAQDREDKKWRGVFRLTLPRDDGSEKDGWSKRAFNNAIWSLEESNPGYRLDWTPLESGDYGQFKGKLVGVLFRNREWEKDGNAGWMTECCALTSISDIREKKFKMPKDKPLSRKAPAAAPQGYAEVDDGDLPF